MDTLNSVEINKVKVTPLSEWNYLITRTPPSICSWPRTSNLLCWWCSHSFNHVPAYLPVKGFLDRSSGQGNFVFTGNFCSWNCVKRYAMFLEDKKKVPDGCFYIGLLAFLTVSKGNPCEGAEMHDLGLCECMDTYQGVRLPPSKELLECYGGQMSIDEYRKGFHMITDYDKIQRNFTNVHSIVDVKNKAMEGKNEKFWEFTYLNYSGPDASYTTFVNILPLTNRTFDKRNLVLTGNESHHDGQRQQSNKTTASSSSSSASASSSKTTRHRNNPNPTITAPRAQKISRRSNKGNSRPMEIASVEPGTLPPPESTNNNNIKDRSYQQQVKKPTTALMTTDQVLACNDEQQFYTNSLRGYGNILTSMGISINNST